MIIQTWKRRDEIPIPDEGITISFFDADNDGKLTYRISDGSFITTVTGAQDFVIAVTYSELVNLKGNWIAGQQYLITDFRTAHYIQFSDSNNDGTGNDEEIHLGNVEPIIVTTVSINELAPIAKSVTFPNDVIRYKLEPTDRENDYAISQGRGVILYREDTINKNIREYDFRNFVYRRWNDGNGNYIISSVLIQTPPDINDYQDFPPFANLTFDTIIKTTNVLDLNVYKTDNVVFMDAAVGVNINLGIQLTFLGPVLLTKISNCIDSVFMSEVSYNDNYAISRSRFNGKISLNIIDVINNTICDGDILGNVGLSLVDSSLKNFNNNNFNNIDGLVASSAVTENSFGTITSSQFFNEVSLNNIQIIKNVNFKGETKKNIGVEITDSEFDDFNTNTFTQILNSQTQTYISNDIKFITDLYANRIKKCSGIKLDNVEISVTGYLENVHGLNMTNVKITNVLRNHLFQHPLSDTTFLEVLPYTNNASLFTTSVNNMHTGESLILYRGEQLLFLPIYEYCSMTFGVGDAVIEVIGTLSDFRYSDNNFYTNTYQDTTITHTDYTNSSRTCYFKHKNVTSLIITNNNLESCDIRYLRELQTFICTDGQLSNLELAGLNSLATLNVSGNPLTSAEVDNILIALSSNPVSNGYVNLTNTDIPTSNGLTAKSVLESRGWTVLVDS